MAGRNTFSSTSSGATGIRAPLSIPGGELAGAELVRELPGEVALPAWQTLRSVLTWAAAAPGSRRALFDPAAMEAWEVELLRAEWEPELRLPLAVLVGGLVDPEGASPERMARACLAVADWALEHGAVSTALAYAEAAAHAWPENPRYAYTCGRLLRMHGRPREAEQWIRHSVRAAVRIEDVDAQTLGLNSLGNTYTQRGSYREAVRIHQQALKLSRRHGLPEREGEILHDLFVATWSAGDAASAEEYARGAFERYRYGHERLPTLAHDVAFSWIEQGYFSRALSVLETLPDFFPVLHERIRVLASTARAAGGCGNAAVFEKVACEMWEIVETAPNHRGVASALVHLAIGATGLERWVLAERALGQAIEIAVERCESDVITTAEQTMAYVQGRRSAHPSRSSLDTRPLPQIDALVEGFLASLQPEFAAGSA